MAKNVMRKVSNSVFNAVADTKKMSSINVAILVVSVAIVVVLVILLVKRSKREGFALINLSEASWVSKGEDGAKGEDGPQGLKGPQGLQGPPGEAASPGDEEKDALYTEFEKKFMDEMVDNKLVVKEGEDKYFPVGTINMKAENSTHQTDPNITRWERTKQNMFYIRYNKQSSNSYVKITYVIPYTVDYHRYGIMFRMFVNDDSTDSGKKQISSSATNYGGWEENWEEIVVKDIKVTGIDDTDEVGERTYSIKIDSGYTNNNIYNPALRGFKTNGIVYAVPNYLFQKSNFNNSAEYPNVFVSATCFLEEVVIADKSKISGDSDKGEDMNFIKTSGNRQIGI